MSDQKNIKYEHTLADLLQFDESDLDLNAQGQMSERQRKNLRRQQRKVALNNLAGLVVGIGLSALFTAILFSQLAEPDAGWVLLALMIVPIAITIWFSYRLLRGTLQTLRDLEGQQIDAIEGRIALDLKVDSNTNAGSSTVRYTVTIEDQTFEIEKPLFLALKNGDPYLIYYAPNTRQILAIEWLREDHPFTSDQSDQDEASAFDEVPKRLRQS
ncbi:MAG: hypothetical protein MUF87_21775 [Anaerolineae bacterium]|jgi:hypothetical protein|nr:hypothetical protein [Anaerolineae bacterium]